MNLPVDLPATTRGELRRALVHHGLFFESSVPGLFGRSERFERVVTAFLRRLEDVVAPERPERVHFPPLMPRDVLRDMRYMENFPQLCGSIHVFTGDEDDHTALVDRLRRDLDWGPSLSPAAVTLIPAGCYPLYPTLTGVLPREGRLFDLTGQCFRHEPSEDPMRLQSFRMHENVRVGSERDVLEWRAGWMERAPEVLSELGLDVHMVVAHDPFFGRGRSVMRHCQLDMELKHEGTVAIYDEGATPLLSLNYHADHFGSLFDIRTPEGEVAHTACVGYGLERVAIALFARHGFDVERWPFEVRSALWP